jgi:hypothetical protein
MRGREPMPRNRSVWPVMVMERGSTRGTQTAASSSRTGASGAGEPRPHSERFWSLLRLVVFLLAALGLGAWGYLLRPTAVSPLSVSEPTITILANQQDVTAVVDMTLSADLGHAPPYSLALTITAVSPSQGIKFTVSFARFPAPAAGTGRGLHTSDNAYYTQINSAPGLSGTALPSKSFTYTSLRPIGENSKGAQLRVAFPNLIGEKPGAKPTSLACGFAASLVSTYRTICTQLGNRPQWAPSLEAGTTTFSSANPPLGDYQYLAGDDPALLGTTTWMWSGINGVEVLAASVPTQANEQNDLFYSGLLLGVAAAAGIACVTELLRPVWRKGTDERKAEATDRSG